jgi:hypothetical protein
MAELRHALDRNACRTNVQCTSRTTQQFSRIVKVKKANAGLHEPSLRIGPVRCETALATLGQESFYCFSGVACFSGIAGFAMSDVAVLAVVAGVEVIA